MPLTVVNSAQSNPVDLTELKEHLRLGGSNPGGYTREDSVLSLMIKAVSRAFEQRYKVQLITADLRWDFSEFKRVMELPRPPFQSVEKVEYYNSEGTKTVIPEADYQVFTIGERRPGRVAFSKDYEFPEVQEDHPYPVLVTYKAGYGDSFSNVPEETRHWLMNTIGTYYMQRESRLISYTGSISVQEMATEMAFLLQGTPKPMRLG